MKLKILKVVLILIGFGNSACLASMVLRLLVNTTTSDVVILISNFIILIVIVFALAKIDQKIYIKNRGEK